MPDLACTTSHPGDLGHPDGSFFLCPGRSEVRLIPRGMAENHVSPMRTSVVHPPSGWTLGRAGRATPDGSEADPKPVAQPARRCSPSVWPTTMNLPDAPFRACMAIT